MIGNFILTNQELLFIKHSPVTQLLNKIGWKPGGKLRMGSVAVENFLRAFCDKPCRDDQIYKLVFFFKLKKQILKNI